MRALAVAGLALFASGCVTHALLGGATIAPSHGFEAAAYVGTFHSGLDGKETGTSPTRTYDFESALRYGLNPYFDVGLRLFTAGAALEARAQIYRGPTNEWPSLSALLAVSGGVRLEHGYRPCFERIACRTPLGTRGSVFAHARLPIGIRVGWFELLFAPHATVDLDEARYYRFPVGSLGGDVALAFHLPRGWRVAPEVVVLVPLTGTGKDLIEDPPVTAQSGGVPISIEFGVGVYRQF